MNFMDTSFLFPLVMLIPYYCFMDSLAMAVRNLTTDQLSLVEFKHHIVDPHNVLASNWTASTSVCNWLGVSCGVKHGRVTSLNLPNMNLAGTIPPHLGNLSFLVYLNLVNNSFHGHLPEELGKLHRLRFIKLGFNGLSGGIPSWVGKLQRVEMLEMSNNNFTGTVPQNLGNMFNLEFLSLRDNQLSGQIPSSIFNISSLKGIYLHSNSLSGSLPDDFCVHLPKVKMLYLHENELSGYIPPSIGKCGNLKFLALYDNRFNGFIPRNIANLTRLKELYLGETNLKGEIPEDIGNLLNLEILNIEGVRGLTGQIPSSISNISSLKMVVLRNNSLSGNLPPMTRAGNLELLSLWGNNLTGQIPASIFNISSLKNLHLDTNSLSGNLPSLTGAANLQYLVIWENNLSGNIPNSISNASMLMVLFIEKNSFSGFIPNALGNLRHLERLQISNNHLTTDTKWSFLSSLANCRNLSLLDVSENQLNGILPTHFGNLSTSLKLFLASGCELKGNFPSQVGNLSNIILLDLSQNRFSGSIPATIGGLRNVQYLDLSANELARSVPENICALETLYYLALSYNKLDGPIPTCLGNLTSLRYLYLSSNKLRSGIPSALWSLQDILGIDLSSNYLSSSLSLDIGHLRALVRLNLSRNLLMSDISSTIGDLQELVSLDLSYNGLHGHIPESFRGLLSLELLDLSKNNLSGVIPKSLEKLSYLSYFNVSFNRLEGEIPTGGSFRNFSGKSFMKNYALCGPPRLLVPPCKSSIRRPSKISPVMSVLKYGLPIVASIILIVASIVVYKKRRSRNTSMPTKDDLLSVEIRRRISHAELFQATDGFDDCNLLGSGSFGSVYKGRLSDGTNVAIKVFNLMVRGAFKSFEIECKAMSIMVHRNIVKVITCCSRTDFKALVLDFMPNGNLEHWLHSGSCFLDILQRIDIMIDVASALEYLRAGIPAPIIHCDLKPSNVLLDEDMVAHVGDFGIAKLLGEGDLVKQTMTLATMGYMAPEYGLAGIVSVKCDMYSYGILLMETFTRKKPTDEIFTEELNMRHWVKKSVCKGTIDIADSSLLRREDDYFVFKANCISSIMELALICSAELPEERIDMKDVVATLKKIKKDFVNNVGQV